MLASVMVVVVAPATPVEAFKVPIEFKRKMGAGGIAKIGLGALGGFGGLADLGHLDHGFERVLARGGLGA